MPPSYNSSLPSSSFHSHSLTHSLTHSLSHFPTHSLPRSLTRSLRCQVNAGPEMERWKLVPFALHSSKLPNSRHLLRGGDAVQLIHR